MVVGYFGLYTDEAEKFLLSTIKNFNNNKIVILPSSFYITDLSNIKELISIFNKHKKLIIFARDYISYLNFKKYLKIPEILECPDIVFYLKNYFNIKKNPFKILIISRNDNEIQYPELQYTKLGTPLSNIIDNTKLINFNFNEYEKILNQYLNILSEAKQIITDTLHISIFAYLLNISCYSLDNKYGKIKNTILQYLQNSSVKYLGNTSSNIPVSKIEFSKLIKIIK